MGCTRATTHRGAVRQAVANSLSWGFERVKMTPKPRHAIPDTIASAPAGNYYFFLKKNIFRRLRATTTTTTEQDLNIQTR